MKIIFKKRFFSDGLIYMVSLDDIFMADQGHT